MRDDATTGNGAPAAHRETHGEALLDAEIGLLAGRLAQWGGTMRRTELARRTDATLWHEGTFEAALRAGVRRGRFVLLAGDLVTLHDPEEDAEAPAATTRT